MGSLDFEFSNHITPNWKTLCSYEIQIPCLFSFQEELHPEPTPKKIKTEFVEKEQQNNISITSSGAQLQQQSDTDSVLLRPQPQQESSFSSVSSKTQPQQQNTTGTTTLVPLLQPAQHLVNFSLLTQPQLKMNTVNPNTRNSTFAIITLQPPLQTPSQCSQTQSTVRVVGKNQLNMQQQKGPNKPSAGVNMLPSSPKQMLQGGWGTKESSRLGILPNCQVQVSYLPEDYPCEELAAYVREMLQDDGVQVTALQRKNFSTFVVTAHWRHLRALLNQDNWEQHVYVCRHVPCKIAASDASNLNGNSR